MSERVSRETAGQAMFGSISVSGEESGAPVLNVDYSSRVGIFGRGGAEIRAEIIVAIIQI